MPHPDDAPSHICLTVACRDACAARALAQKELMAMLRSLPPVVPKFGNDALGIGALERKSATPERVAVSLRELKLAGNDAGMSFTGYGAVFDNVDVQGDLIVKGAFADTISRVKSGTQPWPAMLMQHGGIGMDAESMTPVGIWTSMEEDSIGLKLEGKFADTPRGREAYGLLKMDPRPAIDGLSIGYIPKEFTLRSRPEEPRRTLKKVDLLEVSLVTFPANPKARVQAVKSGLTVRDAEKALRDVGFSQSEARRIVADGFKSFDPRDADDDAELAALLRRGTSILTGG